MKRFSASKLMALSLAGMLAAGLSMEAYAQATPIPGSTGWSIICPTALPCSSGSLTALSLMVDFSNPLAPYEIRFSESAAEQNAASNFGLRTLGMTLSVTNSASNFDITGLHFSLIDPNTGAPLAATPFHPSSAHFHLISPALSGTAAALGTATLDTTFADPGNTMPTNAGFNIDIANLLLHAGQNINLQGAPGFGIHQYEVQGQNRDFLLRVTANGTALVAAVPEPGSVSLMLAGLLGLITLGRQRSAKLFQPRRH